MPEKLAGCIIRASSTRSSRYGGDAGLHHAFEGVPEAAPVVAVALQQGVQVARGVEAVEGRRAEEEHGGEASGGREGELDGDRGAEGVAGEHGPPQVQVVQKTGEAPGVTGDRGSEVSAGAAAETGEVGGDQARTRGWAA